jgi:gluconolactonase
VKCSVAFLSLTVLSTFALAQEVQRLDPALDELLPANAHIQKVAGGFNKWTEGPVWTRSGFLLFAEIPANNIDAWRPGKGSSVFLHPSGYDGATPFAGPEPGSNGMTLDSHGRLTVAGHARRNVWRLESLDRNAVLTVLADEYEGKRLNSPNDVVYKSDGSLYFTDPPYGLPTQSDHDPQKQLTVNGVYRIAGARDHKAGAPPERTKLKLLAQDLPRPNGIAFSPDEKFLYVSNSEPQRVWKRYPVKADGSIGAGTVICDASSEKDAGAPDGIKVDKRGNIWGSGPGGVWVLSPEGKHLATIRIPERVSNVAWGDEDGRTLYITASTSIYMIKSTVGGTKP